MIRLMALAIVLLAWAGPAQGVLDVSNIVPPEPRYEAKIAMVCPPLGTSKKTKIFQNKFLTDEGTWETDYGLKSTCKTSNLEILEYCKQVYPEKDITNILESKTYEKIGGWCRAGIMKCKGPARWVKPFRCLEAMPKPVPPIESQPTSESTGSTTVGPKAKNDEDYYSEDYLDEYDDEDYYYDDDDDLDEDDLDDDDYYDDDDEDDDNDDDDDDDDFLDKADEIKEKRRKLDNLKIDPYFTHYDPKNEHNDFTVALDRLETRHSERMKKLMSEWRTVEEKYESLASSDKEHAEKLKEEMADQFEVRIKDLEKENEGEKEQLIAMHQQRVVSRINQRKDEAMTCYTNSLNKHPISYPQVRDCLEQLLRSLHKDRHHTLLHYRSMVETEPAKADQQHEVTLKHLADIDRIINESLSLLDRFPDLKLKLLPLMEDFLIELRSADDTPSPLFHMDRKHEEQILNGFRENVEKRIQKEEEIRRKEKMMRNMQKKQMESQLQKEREEVAEIQESIKISHREHHQVSHAQPLYHVSEVERATSGIGLLSVVVGCGALLLLLLGLMLYRRKYNHPRSHMGFLEVPTYSSPEEKHLSAMQVNGYENPTYRFFEAGTA